MAFQKSRRPSSGGRSSGGRSSGGRRFSSFNTRSAGGRQRGQKKENINPSRFVRKAQSSTAKPYVATHTFADFELVPLLHKNIAKKNFSTPSPIQDQAIPVGLKGKDVVGVADTGTGKTVAFAVPMLNKLLSSSDSSCIIMAPTRELAGQIADEVASLANGSGLRMTLLIGGMAMRPQLKELSYKPRIIIGTPGRIKDHIQRGSLRLDAFTIAVLDEMDRMLDMGFIDDMRAILKELTRDRQIFFFSATIDTKVKSLIETFSSHAVTISVKTGETSDNVHQDVIRYQGSEDKFTKLKDFIIKNATGKMLIFDETKRGVDKLEKALRAEKINALAIHGGKSQGQRQRALAQFKAHKGGILVATDVAARGLDVSDITHVINYATPRSYDDYVHRIGRAGRAGKMGHAVTFIQGRA